MEYFLPYWQTQKSQGCHQGLQPFKCKFLSQENNNGYLEAISHFPSKCSPDEELRGLQESTRGSHPPHPTLPILNE